MKIQIAHLIQDDSKYIGKKLWVCDFRQPDLDKKAIRRISPQIALLRSNTELPDKNIYYSDNHFTGLNAKGQPVKSKFIPIFDNTGYRGNTGTPINVFDNERECRTFYIGQVEFVRNEVDKKIAIVEDHWKAIRKELTKKIMDSV